MKLKVLIFLMTVSFASLSYADMSDYTTPDYWSKNVTASGVKASSGGINLGEKAGTLSIGLTTRFQLKYADESDLKGFQYLRLRLSETQLGAGTMDVNLNMRLGADFNVERNNPREYFVFYDGLNVEMDKADAALRIYNANVVLNDVLGKTNITIGRFYLNNLGEYKLDGASIATNFSKVVKLTAYYGMPVSYYSDLETEVAGGMLDIFLFNDSTRIRGEYSYFISNKSEFEDTQVAKLRIDSRHDKMQAYVEANMIDKVFIYSAGLSANFDKTSTGFSTFIDIKTYNNDTNINEYVSAFESITGVESEYVEWGVEVYQGIGKYVMVSLGYESRFNYEETYADRDYYKMYSSVDFVGLLNDTNFLSILADYYIVPKYGLNEKNNKLLIGGRMTQQIIEEVDIWLGVNVANYKYKQNPIDLSAFGLTDFDDSKKDETTSVAYIGGQFQPIENVLIQLDYSYDMTNIFDTYDTKFNNVQTVALWVNLLW